jgi:ribose-phosphate pyrophosphokinase
MIKLLVDNELINIKRIEFSDGALSFDLSDVPESAKSVFISVDPDYKVGTLIDELSQLTFILRERFNNCEVSLYLPYLPYARADRKFSDKGNNGLFTFLCMLDTLGINTLLVVDPHNPEAFKAHCDWLGIEYVISDQLEALRTTMSRDRVYPASDYDAIVAPDKGAVNKAQEIADYYGLPLIVCTKERDPSTGKLSNPVVNGNVEDMRLLIVDDLLDAGGTFIQLATELQKQLPSQIDLYVSHLIGSKGIDLLRGKIDNVFCYHTVAGYLTMFDVHDFNLGE